MQYITIVNGIAHSGAQDQRNKLASKAIDMAAIRLDEIIRTCNM